MNNNIKKKVTAVAMAGAIAASSGVAKAQNIPEYDGYMQEDYLFQQNYLDYITNVKNAESGNYDDDFINFYRNGKIVINNVVYSVNSLYVYVCQKDGEKKFMLLCKDNLKIDIITGENHQSYEKIKIMKWINSYCFYELYLSYHDLIINDYLVIEDESIEDFLNVLSTFDGTIHENTPEMYYGKGKY